MAQVVKKKLKLLKENLKVWQMMRGVWTGIEWKADDGCIYKITAKLLASRFKRALLGLFSPTQTTFLPQRQILDDMLVVNEIINLAKRRNDPCLMIKSDFEKAYEIVSWGLLDYMLGRMGFNNRWRCWMKAYIFTSSVSVLVNCRPTKEFPMERGLRQGTTPLLPSSSSLWRKALQGWLRRLLKRVSLNVFLLRKGCPSLCFNSWTAR